MKLSGTAAITKGSTTVTFTSPQTLPANSAAFFAANTEDCVPDSWPNNCKFKAYYTSAAITNATTVTLRTPIEAPQLFDRRLEPCHQRDTATGDRPKPSTRCSTQNASANIAASTTETPRFDGMDDGNATMEAVYFGN